MGSATEAPTDWKFRRAYRLLGPWVEVGLRGPIFREIWVYGDIRRIGVEKSDELMKIRETSVEAEESHI